MRLIALLLSLALPAVALADIKIAKADRIANENPGYCAWCALETLGRHHKIKALEGLVASRKKDPDETYLENGRYVTYKAHSGYDWSIKAKLDKLGVKYETSWDHSKRLINKAIKNDLGFAISFRAGAFGKGPAHAVTGLNLTDDEFTFIDPNDPQSTYTATRAWFDKWWDGWVLVLEKPHQPRTPSPTVVVKKEQPKETPALPPPRPGQVQPVILGLDLKPVNPATLVRPTKEDIIKWRLTKEKE